MEKNSDLLLIDVREEYERNICFIQKSEHIPLKLIKDTIDKLPEKKIIFYCHHGSRSRDALNLAKDNGLSNCLSLSGGISRWADEIELDMVQY